MHCKRHFHEGVMRLGGQCLHPLSACGQAYRYALYKLNPFVVTGSSALYDGINAHGELDRYTPRHRQRQPHRAVPQGPRRHADMEAEIRHQ